jgi:putative acetyltransferase
VEIRPFVPDDLLKVCSLLTAVFPADDEAQLVSDLHKNNRLTFPLVAVHRDCVVGFNCFSPVTTERGHAKGLRPKGLGLGPVAVTKTLQGQGLGRSLIETGIEHCRDASYDFIVVLGDPPYYSRFGFVTASEHGLQNEYGVDAEFMVLELTVGSLKELVDWSNIVMSLGDSASKNEFLWW